MKKTTDLKAVKETAICLLHLDIGLTPFSPVVVKHPFLENAQILMENKETKSLKLINLLEDEEELLKWQQEIKKEIEKAENVIQIYIMITKPYIFAFLKFVKQYLSKEDLSKILGDAWSRVEQSNMDNNLSKSQLVSLFKQCDPKILMDEEEYQKFQNFPETLEIYRGVTTYNQKNIKALSWTLKEAKAKWFATRYSEKGKVYKATIGKQNVLAYFTGRNEAEIVVDPKYLENIEVYKDFSED